MKKLFLIPTLFFSVTTYAQDSADTVQKVIIELNPDSSAIGKPIGETVKKLIGPEGGKISSADGLMELIFPAGAVDTITAIGIQPVESTSIMSFGNAYACTPDGMQFRKPVQLVMHYTDSAAKTIQHAIQTIIWQDKTGRWTQIEEVQTDSVADNVTCNIAHFSTYAPATKFGLKPDWARIKVKQSRPFVFTVIGTYPNGKKYKTQAQANKLFWPGHPVEWKVDGVVGGNDIVGRIKTMSADNMNVAIYTAPAAVPSQGPVITAKYIGPDGPGKGVKADSIAIAVVDIYDEYHYRFTGYDKVGHLYMIDSATCEVQVYSSGAVRLWNIRNPPPWSDWPSRIGKCTFEYPDKTGWKGMVQIEGIRSGEFQRTPASEFNPAATAMVLIQLKSTMGSSPSYKQHCPGLDKTVPSYPVSAQPVVIHFGIMSNSSDVLITYGSATGINSIEAIRGNQGYSIYITHKK